MKKVEGIKVFCLCGSVSAGGVWEMKHQIISVQYARLNLPVFA